MYTLEEVRTAYYKLKNYIYYDSSELLLREKLIEFETDTKKSKSFIYKWAISEPYTNFTNINNIFEEKENTIEQNLEIKFLKLLKEINSNDLNSEYFKYLFSQIKVDFFPKKINPLENEIEINYITNVKRDSKYKIDKIIPFINVPIELHIISIMWIIRNGYKFDAELLDECKGNRLLLNKEHTNLIKNSSLFKPYYTQYQSWRDDSISVAQNLLKNKKNALFINLDIKKYFNSTKIEFKKYFPIKDCVNNILRKLHKIYTDKLIDYKVTDVESSNDTFLLPIGLLSSYIIANHYLNDLDKIIVKKIKPAYYGRYVDDILLVISEPNESIERNMKYNDYQIDYKKYVQTNSNKRESIKNIKLTKVEKTIIENLDPIFQIEIINGKRRIKIDKYDNLYCQQEKTFMYYFDYKESDLVINKLKQELNYRSSEFKDLPDGNENIDEFDKNVLYLNYTDSEGKIRTLKDYKENRFGLTIYLTNKILGATKHKKKISDKEINNFIKIFNGKNTIVFYKLWEKIFTYLLVNKKPSNYVNFYFQCIKEIDKINYDNEKSIQEQTKRTLINYLDSAHELAISLNLDFIKYNKEIKRNFEFKSNSIESRWNGFDNFITRDNSIWALRYRKSNMLRHQYISIPLLNYTKESYEGKINLTDNNINFEKYTICYTLLKNSPRPVKFWECTLSKLLTDINKKSNNATDKTFISDFSSNNNKHFLDSSFERFKIANKNHIPEYIFNSKIDSYKDKFYKIDNPEGNLLKISVNSQNENRIPKPKISIANTKIESGNIISSLRNKTNITNSRYQDLVEFLKSTRKNKSDIVIFPEYFIPLELLSSLIRYSVKNESLVISGLEHIIINNQAYNFVVTVLPVNINGYKDATIVFRLKNHYAPQEKELLKGNHLRIPIPNINRYHIFNWKNIYFSVFYCFELTNILHRSLLKSRIDLLVTVEYNKDVNYFSNLVESVSRDLHCYVAQVNSSNYGDTRITQPTQTYKKDIIKVKGGLNNITLTGTIEIDKLREFQRKKYNLTKNDKSFKALPPDFDISEVLKRINNQ